MDKKQFDRPIAIDMPDGPAVVATVADARDLLASTAWPVRGTRHEQALDACLKVLDGHRSIVDARNALIEAAREAGIRIDQG